MASLPRFSNIHLGSVRQSGTVATAVLGIAIVMASMGSIRATAQDAEGSSQRPSGAVALPPAFDWIYRTGDPRIENILRQAFYLEEHKEFRAAIAKYQELLELGTLGTAVVPTFNSIAGCYGQLENFTEEVNWASKATAAGPDFALSYLNLGNGYLGLRELDRAARAYEKYVALQPDDPRGHYSLGLVAEQRQDWKRAEEFYGRSIELDPNFADGHFNLAVAYANQSKYEPAIVELRKVLAVDPVNDDARAMLRELQNRR
jgi:tetratricopeptide (TPR) repeat protein